MVEELGVGHGEVESHRIRLIVCDDRSRKAAVARVPFALPGAEQAGVEEGRGSRGHGIATHMVDALLAGETVAVYALIDRRFAGHFARWGFRQVGPSELPRSAARTYVISRAVTTLGSLLRRQRIRIVPLLRPAR